MDSLAGEWSAVSPPRISRWSESHLMCCRFPPFPPPIPHPRPTTTTTTATTHPLPVDRRRVSVNCCRLKANIRTMVAAVRLVCNKTREVEVWRFDLAVRRYRLVSREGPRFESASALLAFSSKAVVCGYCLVTLSNTINKMALIAAHL